MTKRQWRKHLLVLRVALALYISFIIKMLWWRWQ
jgi:hypothetical protein